MEGAFVGYEHRFACSAWEVRGSEAGSLWGRASLRSPGFDQDYLAGMGAICSGVF